MHYQNLPPTLEVEVTTHIKLFSEFNIKTREVKSIELTSGYMAPLIQYFRDDLYPTDTQEARKIC